MQAVVREEARILDPPLRGDEAREVVASLIWSIGSPTADGVELQPDCGLMTLAEDQRKELVEILTRAGVLSEPRMSTLPGRSYQLSLGPYQALCGALGLGREERLARMIGAATRAVSLSRQLSNLEAQDNRRIMRIVGEDSQPSSNNTEDLARKADDLRKQLDRVLDEMHRIKREHFCAMDRSGSMVDALDHLRDARHEPTLVHDEY